MQIYLWVLDEVAAQVFGRGERGRVERRHLGGPGDESCVGGNVVIDLQFTLYTLQLGSLGLGMLGS